MQLRAAPTISILLNGYPPVDNDPALFALAHQVGGPELELIEEPLLIAEDFSFYQRHLPGVFFLLGCGVPATADWWAAGRKSAR